MSKESERVVAKRPNLLNGKVGRGKMPWGETRGGVLLKKWEKMKGAGGNRGVG